MLLLLLNVGVYNIYSKRGRKRINNLRNRDRKKVHNAQVSGTDTQSVVDAKQQTSELYSFLAWLEPYIQPRWSSTNLVVVEAKDSDAQDEESTDVENDRMSTRSGTPEPDPLHKSKVTTTTTTFIY